MRKKPHTKYRATAVFALILTIVLCFAAGVLTGELMGRANIPWWGGLIVLAIVVAACWVQLIVHEAGHLVFGLRSGYKFLSFRIGNVMFMKEKGKMKVKLFSLAGTGGQCLMSPPSMVKGKFPVQLYNYGGVLANLIVAAVAVIVLVLGFSYVWVAIPALAIALFGFVDAIINGIPIRTSVICNDGYNAVTLKNNKKALRAFWIQLKSVEYATNGKGVLVMPKNWFEKPAEKDMNNMHVAAVATMVCDRLMAEKKYDEAYEYINHLLSTDNAMHEIHKRILIVNAIYLEAVTDNRQITLRNMLTEEQKKFMERMKNNPSVIRTEYAITLLHESPCDELLHSLQQRKNDQIKAEALLKRFSKVAKHYPYRAEIEYESELIGYARQRKLCKAVCGD